MIIIIIIIIISTDRRQCRNVVSMSVTVRPCFRCEI